ncbi:class III extradiol ring-cleavage dioxygenase [Reinekea sp. G2M2-21]|uniref:DODA-type extradiol aromatic ring-opening family dioxygenase n=1 Tax=Reinekea sp. G2M2-21 TaxID=2788942 RepID=UPI0018AB7955|nr:class III extradiol ring-cleavage dioxygenase [Reinekea sp. G2M2-21]
MSDKHSVIFVPHGGGPLPLLGHEPHAGLTRFLSSASKQLIQPSAIIVVTAHWESSPIRISTAAKPDMLFDYYGFPPETYRYKYPASGHPELAANIIATLQSAGLAAEADPQRGFDHGTFVPLMLMYPDATIPVVQVSLHDSLNPATHIKFGEYLAEFAAQGALILGSGLSFHNLRSMRPDDSGTGNESLVFDRWLADTQTLPTNEAEKRMVNWEDAPYARYCHPREEHLLPLHVCFGVAKALGKPLQQIYSDALMGSQVSAFAA